MTGPPDPLTKKIAITCGDPAGIGPEIIGAWLSSNPSEAAGVAVIGPQRWLATLANGTTKTADIDFQSGSGKWQATAMKVSP